MADPDHNLQGLTGAEKTQKIIKKKFKKIVNYLFLCSAKHALVPHQKISAEFKRILTPTFIFFNFLYLMFPG